MLTPLQPNKRHLIYGIKEGNTIQGRNWSETLGLLVNRYGQQTTVHGLKQICERRTGFKERIVWTFGFITALYLLTSMYALLAVRYQRKQFQTIINETNYPIYKLKFPQIVICNANRLNWARFEAAKSKFLLPTHRTSQMESVFKKIVLKFNTLHLNQMKEFNDVKGKNLNTFNYINFTNVVDFLSWRCDEVLKDCSWRWKSINCCDYFFPRRTSLGQCLAFNSIFTNAAEKMQKQDVFWPWTYGRYGPSSGLRLRYLLREELQVPHKEDDRGVEIMILDQYVYSDFLNSYVNANSRGFVSIGATFSFMDRTARSVASHIRGCVFDDEQPERLRGLKYEFENCFYECRQRNVVESCNCTLDLFFPAGPLPVCKLIDMPCLARNYRKFDIVAETQDEDDNFCDCQYSCKSLAIQTYLQQERLSPEDLKEENGSFVDLNLFWRKSYMITYKTSLVFTWVDLLVSFGGIASLLLGCSLISAVELVFFLFFETPEFIFKKRRSDRRLRELQRESSIKNLIKYDSNN